jgi:hypothetical protein
MVLPLSVDQYLQLIRLEEGKDWSHSDKVQRGLKLSDLLQGKGLIILGCDLVNLGIMLA